ncbi:hypothetical protein KSS87_021319, partial [Heliosperma pusillum]
LSVPHRIYELFCWFFWVKVSSINKKVVYNLQGSRHSEKEMSGIIHSFKSTKQIRPLSLHSVAHSLTNQSVSQQQKTAKLLPVFNPSHVSITQR